MTTKKKLPAPAKGNPKSKTAYKRTCIIISEVQNGYEVEVQWAFNDDSNSANHDDNFRDYVAKTEAEALEIVQEIVPALIEDDVEDDD